LTILVALADPLSVSVAVEATNPFFETRHWYTPTGTDASENRRMVWVVATPRRVSPRTIATLAEPLGKLCTSRATRAIFA